MRTVILAVLLAVQSQAGWSQAGPSPATTAGLPAGFDPDIFPSFHPKVIGPFPFAIDRQSRVAFETIAGKAGVNVVFVRDFQSLPVRLNLDNVSIYVALDTLSARSNSFWQPYDSNTIIVANQSIQNHRDIDIQRLKLVILKNDNTPQQVIDVMNSVRLELALKTAVSIPALWPSVPPQCSQHNSCYAKWNSGYFIVTANLDYL
jgi:hypothetical protein